MKTPENVVDPKAFGCMTLEEAGGKIGLRPGRLGELADAGYAPCHSIDGEGPFFRLSEVKKWAKENLDQARLGMPMPRPIVVQQEMWKLPKRLWGIPGILKVPGVKQPGVYFLVKDGEVVYVGQSMHVVSRIGRHRQAGEIAFSEALFIPCPKSELLYLEAYYIDTLKPEWNKKMPSSRAWKVLGWDDELACVGLVILRGTFPPCFPLVWDGWLERYSSDAVHEVVDAVRALLDEGRAVNLVTVSMYLDEAGVLGRIGGYPTLMRMVDLAHQPWKQDAMKARALTGDTPGAMLEEYTQPQMEVSDEPAAVAS